MVNFIYDLLARNATLFYFGLACLVFAGVCLLLTRLTNTQVYGVNAWYKPFKFAASIGTYSWTMGWYCHYLPGFNTVPFNWVVLLLFGFEVVYIALQAGRGQTSHFNTSKPVYGALYAAMGIAATLVTLYTAYVALLFFAQPLNAFPTLPGYYVWGIRLGLLIFVVFSFQGFAMGSRMSHSVGTVNDNSNLFVVGWSRTVGDLRVAHFIGMHALQVLPQLAFYVLQNTTATLVTAGLYGLLATATWRQALQGKPLFKQAK